jgi:TM2 domain-containing membrane protein YozV
MKKIIYAAILGLFFFSTVYSQDVITKSNGEDINAKIIEITQTEIKYKKFDHLDGPIYTLSLNDIFMVKYENGTKEVFSQEDKSNMNNLPEGVRPGMMYKELKGIYDYNLYTPQYSDPHNIFAAGLCSFFIPGLGQMISGEVGRGLGFFGGAIGCGLIYGIGGALMLGSADPYYSGSVDASMLGTGTVLAICGLVGLLSINIYSIVDAVRVAKVKNMYIRDLQGLSSFELKLSPYIQPASIQNLNTTASVGLSLKATF